jgi:hypothetical protein
MSDVVSAASRGAGAGCHRFAALLRIVTFCVLLFSGGGKALALEPAIRNLASLGYPSWFAVGLGACEVAGAIGLLIPVTRAYVIVALMPILPGAIGSHVAAGQPLVQALPAAVVLASLVAIATLERLVVIQPPIGRQLDSKEQRP